MAQFVRRTVVLAATVTVVALPATQEASMKSLTPVIFVEEVEPCIAFWVEQLGFEKTLEVPEGEKLGFAAVAQGGVEVMYQTRSGLRDDLPELAEGPFDHKSVMLYIQVDDLDPVIAKLANADIVVPERTTFYGAREIGIRAPCGTIVTFAEMTG